MMKKKSTKNVAGVKAMTMLLEKSWNACLRGEIEKPYFAELKEFIQEEVSRGISVFPPMEDVFSAFRYTPFEDVKVVIVGQDPYHGPGQAEGLCFSVKAGVTMPPSLKNIHKELVSDLEATIPGHGSLIPWAKQGVLLLNATLTVRQGEPKSHHGHGWERFTDKVVSMLYQREEPIVFLLWGKSAEEKCETFFEEKNHPHLVLKAAHPSPFSVRNFFGCRHFSKTNECLKRWGKEPIDWQVK